LHCRIAEEAALDPGGARFNGAIMSNNYVPPFALMHREGAVQRARRNPLEFVEVANPTFDVLLKDRSAYTDVHFFSPGTIPEQQIARSG